MLLMIIYDFVLNMYYIFRCMLGSVQIKKEQISHTDCPCFYFAERKNAFSIQRIMKIFQLPNGRKLF